MRGQVERTCRTLNNQSRKIIVPPHSPVKHTPSLDIFFAVSVTAPQFIYRKRVYKVDVMVRTKRTERFNVHGCSGITGPVPRYSLHLSTDDLDQVISGERHWYCFRLETEDDMRELPTVHTYLTFVSHGLEIYREGVPASAPRFSLGELLESRKAAVNLNALQSRGAAANAFELARQFEEDAGNDTFWGWGLVPTNV